MAYSFQFGNQISILICDGFFIFNEVRNGDLIFFKGVEPVALIIPEICPFQLIEQPPELFLEILVWIVFVGQLQVGIIEYVHIITTFHKFIAKLMVVLQ